MSSGEHAIPSSPEAKPSGQPTAEVDILYTKPFAGSVPIKARATLCGTLNTTMLGSFNSVVTAALPAQRTLDVGIRDWVAQFVLTSSGQLRPTAAVCLHQWFSKHDPTGDGSLKPNGFRAVMSFLRKTVVEHAVSIAQAEADEAEDAEVALLASSRPPVFTMARPKSAVSFRSVRSGATPRLPPRSAVGTGLASAKEKSEAIGKITPAVVASEAIVALSSVAAVKAKGAQTADERIAARIAALSEPFESKHKLSLERISVLAAAIDSDVTVDPLTRVPSENLELPSFFAAFAHKSRTCPLAVQLVLKKLGFQYAVSEKSDTAVDGMANRSSTGRSNAPNVVSKSTRRSGTSELPPAIQSAISRAAALKPAVGKPDSLWSWVGVDVFPEISRKSEVVKDLPTIASLPCLQELFDPARGTVLKTIRQLKPSLGGSKSSN
jgi:hypothetical protein